MRMFELREKEVINIKDGCRFGFVCDIIIDCETGCIDFIIVPGPAKVLGMFGREQEYHIAWDCIKQIGDDIILVDVKKDECMKDCL